VLDDERLGFSGDSLMEVRSRYPRTWASKTSRRPTNTYRIRRMTIAASLSLLQLKITVSIHGSAATWTLAVQMPDRAPLTQRSSGG
jgi:hypothetical protein